MSATSSTDIMMYSWRLLVVPSAAIIGAYFGGSWIQFPVGSFMWLLSEANDWRNKGAWTTRKSLQTIYRRTFVSCSEKIKTIKSLCISCTDTPHHYSHPNLDVMRNRILGEEDGYPLTTLSTFKAKTSCPTLVHTREKTLWYSQKK